jgi:hypothetical protein
VRQFIEKKMKAVVKKNYHETMLEGKVVDFSLKDNEIHIVFKGMTVSFNKNDVEELILNVEGERINIKFEEETYN